jgi:hypothetical protein
VVRFLRSSGGIGFLEIDRCSDSIRRPGELSNQRITPYLVRYAAVGFDGFGEAVEGVLTAFVGKCRAGRAR